MLIGRPTVHSGLELAAGQFDALAPWLAPQAYIGGKLVARPVATPAGVGFLEDNRLSNRIGEEQR